MSAQDYSYLPTNIARTNFRFPPPTPQQVSTTGRKVRKRDTMINGETTAHLNKLIRICYEKNTAQPL